MDMQTLAPADSKVLRVAIAGNPNSGKTTIFNALTGMRLKVGNYPGVTIERREGALRSDPTGRTLLIDMPGTYSLAARSIDERIARDALLGWQEGEPPPDAVLIVLDAANLERNLYLATQILDLNLPVVFLCNMMDVARQRGMTISLSRLSKTFGVPVIPCIGNRMEGLNDVAAALAAIGGQTIADRPACVLPEPLEQHAAQLGRVLVQHDLATARSARGAALLLLLRPSQVEYGSDEPMPPEVDQALHEARVHLAEAGLDDVSSLLVQRRYEWLDERLSTVLRRALNRRAPLSDRIDQVLTHKIAGMIIFASIMFSMFVATFWLAEPAMGLIEQTVAFVQRQAYSHLPAGALTDLIADGIVAGVGNIVVFFPQICLLFLFIAVLEDSGYMARAAFLMDRIMRRVGLHGKSFIPLLSSMACTVPGIMATRTIENRRDRLATILVAPLITCSARLPVYFILISLIFPREQAWAKAGVMATIYLAGIVLALTVATILKKTILRGPTPLFVMEMPPYRLPSAKAVLRVVWERGRSFLVRAGTFILAASIVLWAIFYWPRPVRVDPSMQMQTVAVTPSVNGIASDAAAPQPVSGSDPMEQSIASHMGKFIEPLIKPLGYDWRIGVGIIASFTAREIFISTMGIVFSVDESTDGSGALRARMQAAVGPDGVPIFSRATCLSLLVFYTLAMQCIGTLAVAYRESGSWRWPAFLWSYMTLLAYGAAWVTYHIASAFGLVT